MVKRITKERIHIDFYEFVYLDKDEKGYFVAVKNIGAKSQYKIYCNSRKSADDVYQKYSPRAIKSANKIKE
jgi:hypothetical protein